MEKVFKNKTFAYIIVGVLMILQLSMSIVRWCNGGFNGGSLVLCLIMLALLTLIGIGINKNRNLLLLTTSVAVLSVVIYVKACDCSGIIKLVIDNKMTPLSFVSVCFIGITTILLIGSLVLVILKTFGVKKDLRKLNAIFGICGCFGPIIAWIIAISTNVTDYARIPEILFIAVFPLLVACVGYQLEIKE